MTDHATCIVGDPAVEFIDTGGDRPVVLLHSSASSAHQFAPLIKQLGPVRRVIAPNLLGYGRTGARSAEARRTVAGQAETVIEILRDIEEPIDLVGHSFGGVIALELATRLGAQVRRVAVFEPNAFALLNGPGCEADWTAMRRFYAHVRVLTERAAWLPLAARFADFFIGDGAWSSMPNERRQALVRALRYNVDEWTAVMAPEITLSRWNHINAPVLIAWATDTRSPMRTVAGILRDGLTSGQMCEIDRGGHLAPLLRPDSFNTPVMEFLDRDGAE